MAIAERKTKAGRTVTVTQHRRTGNHKNPRGARCKITTEAQKMGNLRRSTMMLTWLLNENFHDGDLLITLDYKKELRPKDSERMQKDFRNFYDRLKRRLKRAGLPPPKNIRVMEIGKKGAHHHHIVMQEFPDALRILRECWTAGGVHVDPLYTDGNYRKIAEYFVKYSRKTQELEAKVGKKLWYPSKGLKKPKPGKIREIKGREIGQIKIFKGYYLDQDSVKDGISEYDGYQVFSYILVKLPEKKTGRGGGSSG